MRAHRIAAAGLAAVTLAACGGEADDDTAGSTTATTATTAGSSTSSSTTALSTVPPLPSTTEAPDGNGGDDGTDEIDSVQWGPDEPPIPDQYSAFAVDRADGLACGSIDEQAEGDDFWELAADVCRVFQAGAPWPTVETVPAPLSDGNAYERCLDGELFAMLDQALTWRDEHPGEIPVVRYPARGTHSACQTSLYDVRTVEMKVDGGCVNGQTLPTPGVPVTIAAPGITGYANPRAFLGGELLCVVEDTEDNALRTFVVVVPSSDGGQEVTIEVKTNYGMLTAAVELEAVDVDTTESPNGTTDESTPTEPTDSTETSEGETPTESTDTDDGSETTEDP